MTDPAVALGPPRERVLDALKDVVDPEVGVNIVDLGLVYGVEVDGGSVHVRLTMTTPACPLGDQIADEAEARIREIEGVEAASVELVWDPPWGPERMSPDARDMLGWGR